MDGACSTNGDRRGGYKVSVGKHEGRPRCNGWVLLKWMFKK
jgi:hypothetical protein